MYCSVKAIKTISYQSKNRHVDQWAWDQKSRKQLSFVGQLISTKVANPFTKGKKSLFNKGVWETKYWHLEQESWTLT